MFLGSESDTDRDEEENQRLDHLALEIAKEKRKKRTIFHEDFQKGLSKAKHQMNLEILSGYKIETELDLNLCKYLGRVNVPGVSETLLKKKGLLVGGKLVGIKWDGSKLVHTKDNKPVDLEDEEDSLNITGNALVHKVNSSISEVNMGECKSIYYFFNYSVGQEEWPANENRQI